MHAQPQQFVPPQQPNQPPALPAATDGANSLKEEDDQASELLAMLGDDFGADVSDSKLDSTATSTTASLTNNPLTPAHATTSSNADSSVADDVDPASPATNDVNSLFAILQGVSGGTTPGGSLPAGTLRKFPLTVSLSQAFQGTTSQIQGALAMRDERLVQALYSGWQDKQSGARFNTKEEYEAAISFNYHITQREKAIGSASLMRRWYQPWSSWVVHRSPYHVPGNQQRNDPVYEKLRDPFMTEDEAKSISDNGGVDLHAGTASGLLGSSTESAGGAAQLLDFDEAGGGGGGMLDLLAGGMRGTGGGDSGVGSAHERAVEAGTIGQSGIGGDRIPMNQVGEDEGNGCLVCHESFESEFDDSTDQWVVKNIRRVPAGLLHATCWSLEAASLPAAGAGARGNVNQNKRALNDYGDGDGPELKRSRN